jgi:hypothetical protein
VYRGVQPTRVRHQRHTAFQPRAKKRHYATAEPAGRARTGQL